MRWMLWMLWMLMLLLALPLAAHAQRANVPVDGLDLDRYAGTWHEVARLPMVFQRNCAGDTTATYAIRGDGGIDVTNRCRTRGGAIQESRGVARQAGTSPAQLEVRFAPRWLSWLPPVWGDYWVVELDPAYGWAVVGGPSRKCLWVLSRTPAMDRATFDGIKARADERGYPVERLLISGAVQ